jgi:toxin secretion/phage lysis holin
MEGKTMNEISKTFMGALAALCLYLCSLNWQLLIIWLMLMLLDVITGNMKHIAKSDWSSQDMKLGLMKKAGEFFLLAALILGQRVLEINKIQLPAAEIFVGIFSLKELGSIIENCIQMGVKVPAGVMKWFRVAQDKIGGSDEEEPK